MTVRLLRRIALSLSLLVLTSAWAAPAAQANSLCVNQGGTGVCFGTIAAAVAAAGSGDTILIAGAASPYLERLNITKSLNLTGDDPATTIIDGAQGGTVIRITTAISVTLANLTIRNGHAAAAGGGIYNQHATLTLNNVIVSDNQSGGGGLFNGGDGGGIWNSQGQLTLNNTTVSGNTTGVPGDAHGPGSLGASGGNGGGIYNEFGTLTLNNSTISGNVTGSGAHGDYAGGNGGSGGGIAATSGTLTLNLSTVSGNVTGNGVTGGTTDGSSGLGGGIYNVFTDLTLNNSTVSGNQTGLGATGGGSDGVSGGGAGLFIGGTPQFPSLVTINTSTLSNNFTGRGLFTSAGGDGGAIYNNAGSTINIANSTLAYNGVDADKSGGALANNGGTINIKNSLLGHNHNAYGPNNLTDCSGTIVSQGYNVMMEPVCDVHPNLNGTTGDLFYVSGLIVLPLADNGGPTLTNALPPGSPAIDAADNSTCSPIDQRGFPRPVFGATALRCDIGAFELYRFGVSLPLVVR